MPEPHPAIVAAKAYFDRTMPDAPSHYTLTSEEWKCVVEYAFHNGWRMCMEVGGRIAVPWEGLNP